MKGRTSAVNPWKFFILSFGISWSFWILIIVSGWNAFEFPAVILGAFGLFGPAIAEIILIRNNREQWRDYWQRVFDVKRIGWRWHLVIWLTFPFIDAFAIFLSVLAGSPFPHLVTAKNLLSQPGRFFLFVIFTLFIGPIPEELGWRGYALDGLQMKYNALISSLIVGIIWALWHFPLFFMKGTFQHALGMLTLNLWIFVLGTVVTSILFTWIYNNTCRSTLSAILFHFMINLSGELLSLTEQARIFTLILVTLFSVIVVFIFGPKTLKLEVRMSVCD